MSINPQSRRTRLLGCLRRATFALLTLMFTAPALADPPTFTGDPVLANGPSTLVNLRAQGAINGTAPMNVQVTGVRVAASCRR